MALSQVPQGVNYQAVAYDANGFEISSRDIGVRISIIEGSTFGTPQLVELHDVTTSTHGLFSLLIGQGNKVGGAAETLSDVSWGTNTYFLKVELDIDKNGSYMDFGTQQFMSVPYALYAESSGTPGPEGPEGEPGKHGLNCWDVNSNGLNDLEEDTNNDGEYNALDCMWVLSNSSSSPLGVILPYAASTAPEGWMVCDGSEISRDEYSDLFSLIDTTYGPGNGNTTFNIPNLSGRIPVGLDINGNTISNAKNIGDIGGEETHTLTKDEMPSHSHDYLQLTELGNIGMVSNYGDYSSSMVETSTSIEGANQPHNNMQPYLVTNYIIKIVDQVNPNIDGINQIPPLGEILELQHKVDSLQSILINDINEVYESHSLSTMTDTIFLSVKKGRTITLSGNISADNQTSCQCDLKITDLNNVPISLELIKGTGVTSSHGSSGYSTSIMSSPFVSNASYLHNRGVNFSYSFEMSINLEIKIFVSSNARPCDYCSSNVTVKH